MRLICVGTRSTLLLSLLLPLLSFTALGQQSAKQAPLVPKPQPAASTVAAPTASHDMNAADIGAFLDGLMPLTLERDDIAGAVVTVVKDGKIIFAKGYGYSDVKAKKPVSPSDTLFRPGSISKLFTWTAVMQQVQHGKLDLDTDVNQYLDFKIPAKFDRPITLRDIMTHSAGFSETIKDLFIPDAKDMKPLREYLINHMPERIYPPGTTPAYSNYATALAGYIVQRVSGKPFEEYVQENIFTPLQMPHTTFVQPLPDALKGLMSNGYKVASQDPKPYEIVEAFPAGSVATSATDMAHFMIAQLQGGEYDGARILDPKTVELMHTRQRSPGNSDALNGMALGFYEETSNGHRIFGHGGDTILFHSDLHLMPDANLGFFVSYNSPGKGTVSNRTALWQKFLDRYFPYPLPATPALASAAADAGKVSGQYMISRRLQGNFLNALAMAGEAKVSANKDNTISVDALHGLNGEPMKFVEIAPLAYRNVDGQERVAFYQGYDGRMTFGIDYPFMVFQKVDFLESKSFNMSLVYFSLGVMVLTLLFWPIAAMLRKHYGQRLALAPLDRRLRLITRLACIAYIVLLAGIVGILTKLENFSAPADSYDKWIHLLQILGVFGVIGSLASAYYAVRTWRSNRVSAPATASHATAAVSGSPATGTLAPAVIIAPKRWFWGKLSWTVVALACLSFAWILLYWGALNFNLNY